MIVDDPDLITLKLGVAVLVLIIIVLVLETTGIL